MVKSAALSLFFSLFFYGCAEWDLGLDAKNDGSPPPPLSSKPPTLFLTYLFLLVFLGMIPSPLFTNRVQEQLK